MQPSSTWWEIETRKLPGSKTAFDDAAGNINQELQLSFIWRVD